jgi:DNA (cytosine-5)-methyltransferase 1
VKNTYRFIDIYSGAGGFAEGFTLTGRFKPILGIDNFRPAGLSYISNFPYSEFILEDAKRISSDDIFSLIGRDSFDIIIGSPPCEPFTGANPRRKRNPLDRLYSDPAGQLTLHYIRFIGALKPRVFVMENVPAITDDGLKKALILEFRRAGYSRVFFNILKAEDYGTPSHRLRVFISNIKIKPEPCKHRITVGEALRDMPPPGILLPNHEPPPTPSYRKLKRTSSWCC